MKLTKTDPVQARCVGCGAFGAVDRETYRPPGWALGLGYHAKSGRFLLGPWCPSCRKRMVRVELDAGADLKAPQLH